MTNFTTKELKGKNEAELGAIAEDLGLQLNVESMNKNDIITEIVQAYEEDKSDVVDEIVVSTVEVLPEVVQAEKKFRIIISNQEGVDQSDFVKVQPNGVMYAIPRDVEVVVPESVINVLKDAVVLRYTQEGENWVERRGKRFPYTVLGPA
jgi:hypothetical protein